VGTRRGGILKIKTEPISKIPYIHLSFSLSAYTSDFGLRQGKRFCIRLEKRPPFTLTLLQYCFFSSLFFLLPKEKRNLNLKLHGVLYVLLKEIWVKFLLFFVFHVFPIRLLALKCGLRPCFLFGSCVDG